MIIHFDFLTDKEFSFFIKYTEIDIIKFEDYNEVRDTLEDITRNKINELKYCSNIVSLSNAVYDLDKYLDILDKIGGELRWEFQF